MPRRPRPLLWAVGAVWSVWAWVGGPPLPHLTRVRCLHPPAPRPSCTLCCVQHVDKVCGCVTCASPGLQGWCRNGGSRGVGHPNPSRWPAQQGMAGRPRGCDGHTPHRYPHILATPHYHDVVHIYVLELHAVCVPAPPRCRKHAQHPLLFPDPTFSLALSLPLAVVQVSRG